MSFPNPLMGSGFHQVTSREMDMAVSPPSLCTSAMSDADKIAESALRLPAGERTRLATRLLESLDDEESDRL
jgi:hypothetical protein